MINSDASGIVYHAICGPERWEAGLVHYVPYVGAEYFEGLTDGLRVLLVGESHYEKEGVSPEESRLHTVRNFSQFADSGVDLSGDTTFFRRVGQLPALNDNPGREQVAEVWRRIAFTNFVQGSVGARASDRPRSRHWRTGEPALREILNRLAPDAVLLISKTVWNRIGYGSLVQGEQIQADKIPRNVWWLPHAGGGALCTWVYHPSWNLESQKSRIRVLSELLRIAGDRKTSTHPVLHDLQSASQHLSK